MILNLLIPTKRNSYEPYITRRSSLALLTFFLFTFNVFSSFLFPDVFSQVSASTITAGNIIQLTNSERASAGLHTLKTDSRLNAAAASKAQDMLGKDYWDHYGPNGETPWQFISGAGYAYVYAGENLAKGFSTAEGVHQAWMASPTHKANLMNTNYRDIGVAVVEGELQGENVVLVVQMFGSTTLAPPSKPSPTPAKSAAPTQPEKPSTQAPAKPEPVEEVGEIKSISIEKPADGDVITDPELVFSGSVEGYESNQGSYKVLIQRDGDQVATATSNQSSWIVSSRDPWDDGEYNVIALVEDTDLKSSPIAFEIDSTPPILTNSAISVLFVGNHAEVRVRDLEEGAEVELQIGGETYAFAKEQDGTYAAYIPRALIEDKPEVEKVMLLTDKHGNVAEVDINSQILGTLAQKELQPVSSDSRVALALQGLSTLDLRARINLGFALFLLTVLAMQVVVYKKKRMMKGRGGYIMTIAIFTFLVMLGTLTELGGSIG